MSENHERGTIFCAQSLYPELEKIGQEALRTSEARYSSGFPDYRGGSERKLGYNNKRHNLVTGKDAVRLLGYLGFSEFDLALGRVTGESHDRDQLNGRGIDEYKSAVWLEAQLYDAGVPMQYARRAALAIQGTEPLFNAEGVVIDQKVNNMGFDSIEDELWAKAIACADLSELYTPIGPLLSRGLYRQKEGLDATQTPSMEGLYKFLGNQLRLLTEFEYPLYEAETVFATHRRQVCNYVAFVHAQVGRNGIDGWSQLTDWDLQFMSNPDINLSHLR